MSTSCNRVTLVGNVGKDPDIRSTSIGKSIVSFPLATSVNWKCKETGEKKVKTMWHNIVIYNKKLAELAGLYVVKGSKLYIEGAILYEKWTDDSGVTRTTTKIVLGDFDGALIMLSGTAKREDFSDDSDDSEVRNFKKKLDSAGVDLDDDIPF